MIRLFYSLFRSRIHDLFVEEFLYTIPYNVSDPALTMLKENRAKVEKLVNYQAYHLHRRMVADRKNSERYQGMLIQLALFIAMINQRTEVKHKAAPDDTDAWYQKAMDGLASFRQKLSPTTHEVDVKS